MNMLYQDLVSTGRVWSNFCDQLKKAGDLILTPDAPVDIITRAEGYRYLTRLLRYGLESQLEFSDRDFPVFFAPSHETIKIGGDNPDNRYLRAELNGEKSYRIIGNRGTASYLSFSSQSGGYETNGRMDLTGFLDGANLQIDSKGSFEIIVSVAPFPGNWLPMTRDTTAVIVRQTFKDRTLEVAADIRIEPLDSDSKPAPLTAEKLAVGLDRALRFVYATSHLFADWAASYADQINQLPPANQALCQSVGGDPNIFYYHGQWRLSKDELLIVEVPWVPECETWNFQVDNYWYESLDYRYHKICINKHSAVENADGGVTIVIGHEDPPHPNWLETANHEVGTLLFRWVKASQPVHPKTRVVKLSEWRRSCTDPEASNTHSVSKVFSN